MSLFFALALALVRPDLPIGHITSASYGDWHASGTAFRKGPATGAMLPKQEIENAKDDAVISSEVEDDVPMGSLISPDFKIDRKYIAFRVGGGSYEKETAINLLVGNRIVQHASGRRSDRLIPVSWDVRRLRGKVAHIEIVDNAGGDWGHINVDHIVQTDAPEAAPLPKEPLYHEVLRPQFHFTARQWTVNLLEPGQREEGWINDLNGLIYYDGEYHLFAQRWARCWLHAVSKDLIHWTELQPAFWEETPGSGSQSGTCVIDYHNTSGLSHDPKNPPMIAFWSRFDNVSQCLCYSLDHGRTWTRYPGNPYMEQPERDPKVFWYEPGKHWVMMLYGNDQYRIFTSPDLLHWTDEHHPIPNSFECPDFFELPLDGDASRKKWVLIQGNGNYSIGTFDGKEFKEEIGRYPCDTGPNFYATQSWANTETGDGRRIQTAWMRSDTIPKMPFNQQISFPCQLALRTTSQGPRIFREPIAEIEKLHESPVMFTQQTIKAGDSIPLISSGQLYHLKMEVEIPEGAKLHLNLRGVPVTFTSKTVENGNEPAFVQGRIQTVEVLLDRISVEVFANSGELSSTRYALPNAEGLSLKAEGGTVTVKSMTLYPLKSIWPK